NTLTYDGKGDVVQIQGPTGCLTRYEYDERHRITRITGLEGFATDYGYDGRGRVRSRSVAGDRATYSYHHVGDGTATVYQDPEGHLWTTVLDSQGNIVEEIDPVGAVRQAAYDDKGMPTRSVDALGYVTSF